MNRSEHEVLCIAPPFMLSLSSFAYSSFSLLTHLVSVFFTHMLRHPLVADRREEH